MPLKALFLFFQKMGYLIYFEIPAFKFFHLSIPCGDPKSVATPEDLKCVHVYVLILLSLPSVLTSSDYFRKLYGLLSVLPFYPFPWAGRSSGNSVQHPTVPGAAGADDFLWLLFPVQCQSVLWATPMPLAAHFRSRGCSEVKWWLEDRLQGSHLSHRGRLWENVFFPDSFPTQPAFPRAFPTSG